MSKLSKIIAGHVFGLTICLAVPACALESAPNGKVLAQRWCATCHLVSPGQATASADVPTFMTLAKRSDREIDKLPNFLAHPHPVMPDMQLTRSEIADIVAYIRSLK